MKDHLQDYLREYLEVMLAEKEVHSEVVVFLTVLVLDFTLVVLVLNYSISLFDLVFFQSL